jgi:hypothetical protein
MKAAILARLLIGGWAAVSLATCSPAGPSGSPSPTVTAAILDWCFGGTTTGNRTAVAAEMDLMRIQEPSPGWLQSRVEAAGYRALSSAPIPWALANTVVPDILDQLRSVDPVTVASACTRAYERSHPPLPS